jgi:hypothetical protein
MTKIKIINNSVKLKESIINNPQAIIRINIKKSERIARDENRNRFKNKNTSGLSFSF